MIVALSLALVLLMGSICACQPAGDGPQDTSGESYGETLAEGTTQDGQETTADIPAESIPDVKLTPNTLSVEDGQVKLNLTVDAPEVQDAEMLFELQAGEAVLDSQRVALATGTADYTLACGQGNEGQAMTLNLTVINPQNSQVLATATLKMKNGLPQLTPDGIYCVVAAMTLEEKANMVTGTQKVALAGASGGTYAIPRLGIPSITVNDGPAGVRYGTTVWYPSVINVSSSWDKALAEAVGVSMAEDALAQDVDIILAPGMNIQKNVLGGRNFEYVSEDPILTAYIATAYTQGIQSLGVGVSLKHFAANNQETARGSVSANVTERALREIYLKAFGMTVEAADPYTIMSSYNLINGQRVATRYDLLTTYLREEVGFEGFVMSDWGSGGSVVEKVNAGNDINMPGNATDPQDIIKAYNAGKLDTLMLDAACRNILGVVVRCHNYTDPGQRSRLDYKNHGQQVADVAADTMVLLQNNNQTLPLAKDTTVAILGNGAFKTVYGGAGSGSVSAKTHVSIADGLQNAQNLQVYDMANNPFVGCEEHSALDASKDVVVSEAYAKALANGADVAVIVISRGSTEGADRNTLAGDFKLNQTERAMIDLVSEAFHAKGKGVVVLLNTGSPIEVMSWRDSVDAILWVGYPGERAGTSVASVLTGEVNPSAKTTITWPTTYDSTPASRYFPGNASGATYYEDIYVGYRYYQTFGVDVAYPFGYGLSYTNYTYSDFTVEKQADGSLVAKVTVTNTGSVAGREVVQVYVSKPETLLEQATIELAGFGKSDVLGAGESQTLTIVIPVDALESYDTANHCYFIEQGEFTLSVGASVVDLKASVKLTYDQKVVLREVENIATPDADLEYIQKDTYQIPDPETKLPNLALDKQAYDNGNEGVSYGAGMAVDGDYITRWSGLGSSASIHQWTVDLGEDYAIGCVVIAWESVQVPYTLSVSTDGQKFKSVGVYEVPADLVEELNLYGQTCRYLRVSVPVGGFCSILEFEAYEATEEDLENAPTGSIYGENIALGKGVTATSNETSYIKDYANDGDFETRWGSLPTGDAWLQVDLGEVTHISAIKIYLESAWVPYRVEVSVDGATYETIYTGKKDELIVTLTNVDKDVQYVRLSREGSNWFSIIEIEVYA